MTEQIFETVPASAPAFVADVERALGEIAGGRAVVVVDDHDRENEGDLIFAAECATPELVAFTIRYAPGCCACRWQLTGSTHCDCPRCARTTRIPKAPPTR